MGRVRVMVRVEAEEQGTNGIEQEGCLWLV